MRGKGSSGAHAPPESDAPVLGVLVEGFGGGIPGILDALVAVAEANGIDTVIGLLGSGTHPHAAMRAHPGIAALAVIASSYECADILETSHPVIFVSETSSGGLGHDRVHLDAEDAGRRIAEYIASAGRTSVALVDAGTSDGPLVRGFLAGVSIYDLNLPATHVVRCGADGSDLGSKLGAAFGAARTLPQAVFCTDGDLASRALEIIRHGGFRVPEDMWILGRGFGAFARAPLYDITTVAPPPRSVAEAIVELLRRRLSDPGGPAAMVSVRHRLYMGGTTDLASPARDAS
jgi:DNA-binding LacI/PurR family transcriptional regulator